MVIKILCFLVCISLDPMDLCSQSIVDNQPQRLYAELENLKSINQELRREYDSLKSLYNSYLPCGYYLRLNDGFAGKDGISYRIIRDQVASKQVYSITSFPCAVEAYRMAAVLRRLKLGSVEVVYHGHSPPSSKKISRSIMEIED